MDSDLTISRRAMCVPRQITGPSPMMTISGREAGDDEKWPRPEPAPGFDPKDGIQGKAHGGFQGGIPTPPRTPGSAEPGCLTLPGLDRYWPAGVLVGTGRNEDRADGAAPGSKSR